MKAECEDFLGTVDKIVTTTVSWTQNFKSISVEEISGIVRNWQVMTQVDNYLLFSICFVMFST